MSVSAAPSLSAASPSSGAPSTGAGEWSNSLSTFALSKSTVIVRFLEERDVRALEWHGGADLRSFYEWQWREHQTGERPVLIADFNDFPIGQMAIHWSGKSTHPSLPDIQSLRVFEAFRGMGIGSHLLEVGERLVAARGHSQLCISVGLDNVAARKLYERKGYQVTGDHYIDRWQYTDLQGNVVPIEETVLDLIKTLSL